MYPNNYDDWKAGAHLDDRTEDPVETKPPRVTPAPDRFLCRECRGIGFVCLGHPNDPSTPEVECPTCDGKGAVCAYCGELVNIQSSAIGEGFYVAPNGDAACHSCATADDWD